MYQIYQLKIAILLCKNEQNKSLNYYKKYQMLYQII